MAPKSNARSRSPKTKTSASSKKQMPGAFKFDSKLALALVKQWSWGHKSATQVQKDAALAYADEADLLKS